MCGITKYRLIALLAMQVVLFSLKAQCIITTIAGNGTAGYNGDNILATSAEFAIPNGNAIDQLGNVFIADAGNNRIRKIEVSSGIITTVAGNGTIGYSGDGGLAIDAELFAPTGVTFDASYNLFIADFNNNVIRKINTNGIISTIAGNGALGYSGDGGQATSAKLSSPRQIAFDTSGNLCFSDEGNYVIRKIIISTGIIATVVGTGTGGYSGDGGMATAATLGQTGGLCFDRLNNLYITDTDTNVIRKIVTSTGIITTIVGNDTAGYSGDGGQAIDAKLNAPVTVVTDSLGNLYISDDGNSVIRKVNTAGIISTIVGTGVTGFSGDGGSPLAAELKYPVGIALDAYDNLYIVDYGNNRVRKISNVSTIGIKQYAANNGQMIV